MSYKTLKPHSLTASTSSTYIEVGPKTQRGQETWFVTSDGQKETIVTSTTSATAMDEAVTIYRNTLKRLAQK